MLHLCLIVDKRKNKENSKRYDLKTFSFLSQYIYIPKTLIIKIKKHYLLNFFITISIFFKLKFLFLFFIAYF